MQTIERDCPRHAMNLPDYYPFSGGTASYYVGGWSAMGDIGAAGPDYFAWDKWRPGWLTDDSIDCVAERGTSQHILTPLETSGGKKAAVVAVSQTTALVAEVRTTQGVDGRVCAPGVLLYTVDTTITTGNGPVRVLDANPNTGGCGPNYREETNDGTLSLDGRARFYNVPEWGVKVTLLEQNNQDYKVQVEYS